jgi:UPF0755 protein
LKTPQELVTLASIVEKETGVPEERPVVASVFLNRLDQNIRLQSDPTIIYGIVGGKGKLDRPISKADIDADTPYNTYRINGLPPGPIANPGKAALEAVLNPADSKYIYFVADGTGGHAFAATLDEHNANVKKWRAQQNADPAVPATAATPAKPGTAATPDPNSVVNSALPDVPADPTIPEEPNANAGPVPPEPDAVPPDPTAKPADAAKPAEAAAPTEPAKPAAAAATPAKPGSTVTVSGKKVPIPIPKKPKK